MDIVFMSVIENGEFGTAFEVPIIHFLPRTLATLRSLIVILSASSAGLLSAYGVCPNTQICSYGPDIYIHICMYVCMYVYNRYILKITCNWPS